MKRTGPTNIVLRKLIRELRKLSNEHSVEIWNYVADILERPSRRKVAVNVSKINRYAKPGEYVIVPGKVLGAGALSKPVTVAAVTFSGRALEKISKAGGTPMFILDLAKMNPKGSGVRLIV